MHNAAREVMPGTQRLGHILARFETLAMQGACGNPAWWLRQFGGTAAPGVADWRCFETRDGAVFVVPGSGIRVGDGEEGAQALSAEGAGLLVSLLSAAWMLRVYPLFRQRSRELLGKLSTFAAAHAEYRTIVHAVFSIGLRFGHEARWSAEMLCARLAVENVAHAAAATGRAWEGAAA